MKKVVVVGGGAAGMIASIKAAEGGHEVIVVEKNEKLGKKVFITGKGRCNVTTSKEIEEIIGNIKSNSSFMYSALYTFTNHDLMKLLESRGVKLKIERGDRVFPESDKSSDIIRCFEKYMSEMNIKVIYKTSVIDILTEDKAIRGVRLSDNTSIMCDAVILATGGKSYPITGSTGDGYKLAERLGHSIVEIRPSLIPLITKEAWAKELMGLSLKNVELSVKYNNRVVYSDFGEMLFTHFGISGPVVLSASRKVTELLPKEVEVTIDLKPALDMKELDKRILRDFEKYKNKHFKNSLDELLPQKMIPVIVGLSKIDPEKSVNSITKEERINLASLLKGLKLTIIGTRPIEEAIITKGGINVKEIDPSTMESKLIKHLYIAGELLDVDALTGGFNLQVAFSTGYCAGMFCLKDEE